MHHEGKKKILRPDSSLFWVTICNDKLSISGIIMSLIWTTFITWPYVAGKQDPLAIFVLESPHNEILWGMFIISIVWSIIAIGIAILKFYRIRYILTETGIIFGSGINYIEDIVPWAIINDVDMTRSVLEQVLGVGTIWISAENVRRPMLYLKHYKEIRAHLLQIVKMNYRAARRVTRV